MRCVRSSCILTWPLLLAAALGAGACEDTQSNPDAGPAGDRGIADAPKPGELGGEAVRKDAAPAGPGRVMTFKNLCPYEVWVGYTGSSASQIACSKNTDCQSGVCNGDHVCECSQDTHCPSPQVCDTTNKRCQCGPKGACGAHQKCDSMNAKWRQCFWIVDAPLGAGESTPSWRLPAYSGSGDAPTKQTRLPVRGTARDTTQVWSGAFYPRAGCDGIGRNCSSGDCGKCNPWEGPSARPHTRVEMTLQNNQDWYNLSLIHGFNVPVMVAAEKPTGADWGAAPTKPESQKSFWCGNPGGTSYATAAVTGTTGWEGLGCKWDLEGTAAAYQPPAGWPVAYRFVTDGETTCAADKDCAAGEKCGLSYKLVADKSGKTTCGSPIGWWSADQICATQPDFKSAVLDCTEGINEGSWTSLASLLGCAAGANKDHDSCYSASPAATCCGCTDWSLTVGGKTLTVPATATCDKLAYQKWVDKVLPGLKFLKAACPQAYAYPFDDPASTWTCSTTGQNTTGYVFTFCPDKLDGGVKPPASPRCTCTSWHINSADSNGVTVVDKDGNQVGKADGEAGKGKTVEVKDPSKGPFLIQITAIGGAVVDTCHVSQNALGCLQPAPQGDDSCDYFEFLGKDCVVSAAKITAP